MPSTCTRGALGRPTPPFVSSATSATPLDRATGQPMRRAFTRRTPLLRGPPAPFWQSPANSRPLQPPKFAYEPLRCHRVGTFQSKYVGPVVAGRRFRHGVRQGTAVLRSRSWLSFRIPPIHTRRHSRPHGHRPDEHLRADGIPLHHDHEGIEPRQRRLEQPRRLAFEREPASPIG